MPSVEPCFIEGASLRDIDKATSQDFVADLWRYAKANYADKGVLHAEALPQMSADLGIPERILSYIMDKPKAVRAASQTLTDLQRQRTRFLNDNRRYIEKAGSNDVAKAFGLINDLVRGSLLAAHGPVIGAIHPIDFLFTPGRLKMFRDQYWRAVKSFNKDQTDAMMIKMMGHDPKTGNVFDPVQKAKYDFWKNAGLPIEPKAQLEGFHIGGWGGRAMEAALKPLMMEYADKLWNNIKDPALKYTVKNGKNIPNKIMAQDVAQQASFAAGAIPKGFLGHGPIAQLFSKMQLARSLNVARWMKTVFDPAKTIAVYSQAALSKATSTLPESVNIKGKIFNPRRPPPTPEALQGASNRMRSAGRYLGGMMGALIANDQVAKWAGSNARVNFSDPSKSDYFAFRVKTPLGDYYIKTRGSMEVLQILARTIASAQPYKKQKYGQSPEETFGRYTEYKMTPSISLAKEIGSGRDVFGRPVPWSREAGTLSKPKYTYPEYIGQHLPIFLGHGTQAFYEGLREAGVNPTDINAVIRGVQRDPKIAIRALAEGGAEFLGINPQKVRKKPGEL